MRRRMLLVLALAGCLALPPARQPETAPPSEPTPAPATEPGPAQPVADAKAPSEPSPPAQSKPPLDLCTALCVESRQMQAMSVEAIESQCKTECDSIAAAPPNAECAKLATAARKRADKPSMNKRAPWVWKQMNTALACGHADPVLDRLAQIGAKNAKTREQEFFDALAADPHFVRLCPAGVETAKVVAGLPHAERTPALVERCPLTGVDVEGAAKDIPVATLLAIETVAMRWKAYGATAPDHAILLDTLRLSSALAATK